MVAGWQSGLSIGPSHGWWWCNHTESTETLHRSWFHNIIQSIITFRAGQSSDEEWMVVRLVGWLAFINSPSAN